MKSPSDRRKKPVAQAYTDEPDLNQGGEIYHPEAKVLFPDRSPGGLKDKRFRHHKSKCQRDRKGERHRVFKWYKIGNQNPTKNINDGRCNADEKKTREPVMRHTSRGPRKFKTLSVHFRATTKNCFPSNF